MSDSTSLSSPEQVRRVPEASSPASSSENSTIIEPGIAALPGVWEVRSREGSADGSAVLPHEYDVSRIRMPDIMVESLFMLMKWQDYKNNKKNEWKPHGKIVAAEINNFFNKQS